MRFCKHVKPTGALKHLPASSPQALPFPLILDRVLLPPLIQRTMRRPAVMNVEKRGQSFFFFPYSEGGGRGGGGWLRPRPAEQMASPSVWSV